MLQSLIVHRKYLIRAATAANALGITEPVQEWSWEGVGLNGNVLAQIDTIYDSNNPKPPWWQERERILRIPFADIYTGFLAPEVTPNQVAKVTMQAVDADPGNTGTPELYLAFDRNGES